MKQDGMSRDVPRSVLTMWSGAGWLLAATLVALSSGCSDGPSRHFGDNGPGAPGGGGTGPDNESSTAGGDAASGRDNGTPDAAGGDSDTGDGGNTRSGTGGTRPGAGGEERASGGVTAVAGLGGEDLGTAGTDTESDGHAGTGDAAGDTGFGGADTGDAGSAGDDNGSSGGGAGSLEDGSDCSVDLQCRSRHCVDDVCCDSECDGQCESCNESGKKGQCSTVQSGVPRGSRPACDGTDPCQGECDGRSGKACSYPGADVVCSPASCDGGTVTTASVCNGAGTCTGPETSHCASGQCESGGAARCEGSCSPGSCGADAYCDATGACLPLKDPGELCPDDDSQCEGNHCVDGVCCDSDCSGQCQMCDSSGTCVRVTSGAPRGDRPPCDGSGTCAGSCDGSSDTQCHYPGASKVCTEGTCNAQLTVATSASVCTGAGVCSSAQDTTCDGADYCSGGQCVDKLADGDDCDRDIQCSSGRCADDAVCCTLGLTVCDGSCVDTATDSSNCSKCGVQCGAGLSCSNGGCCPAGKTNVGGICCYPGESNCNGECFDLQNDSQHCGTCYIGCSMNQECQGGSCECAVSTLSCGYCGSWAFDSDTTELWLAGAPDPKNPPTLGELHVESGSLAFTYQGTSAPQGTRVHVLLCGSTGVQADVGGYGFSADIRFDGTTLTHSSNAARGYVGESTDTISWATSDIALESNKWLKITGTWPAGQHAAYLGVSLSLYEGWTGTVLIDNIQLTPP
ncbi:MAG: hypothetical protein JW940_00635 [Polyangiaceae bacterium]|nr:hypothetical protein [Polyangiaceae bacterium]